MPVSIHVKKDPVGLEVGSGGTAKTVGIHGGGLCIDIEVDRNYADARRRWEAGLSDEERETAIQRERAVIWYYTSILLEADPSDKEDSMKQLADALNMLVASGWQVVESRIENNPALTGPCTAMWAELRKIKTRQEQEM